MYYAIHHATRFRYFKPISENVMEVRMQPLSDDRQQCLSFHLSLRPPARVNQLRDPLDNIIHYFDLAAAHQELVIIANAVVIVQPSTAEAAKVNSVTWEQIDQLGSDSRYWELLRPSRFTAPTPLLEEFASEIGICRGEDPLADLTNLNSSIHSTFTYAPDATKVDSPIDQPLRRREGVCQDFTHVMLALVRTYLKIPCRYVSGYLFHRANDTSADDATHAWIEAYLPNLGWVGLDPTNNVLAGERHIRVGIGRDYSDVPPTHGVFRGDADSELSVSVKVNRLEGPLAQSDQIGTNQTERYRAPKWYSPGAQPKPDMAQEQQQQQQ